MAHNDKSVERCMQVEKFMGNLPKKWRKNYKSGLIDLTAL